MPWVWLNVTYACGGVYLEGERITDAAPIYRWMIGKSLTEVIVYLKRKRQYLGHKILSPEVH